MKIFSSLYATVMRWSQHKHAPKYLAAVSFMESSFFPIPVAFMLAPMVLAVPSKAYYFALIATISSVLGGLLGYACGYFLITALEPWIIQLGYQDSYQLAQEWFDRWGFAALFLAGFSPIPYKIFTIAAGSLSMALMPFVLASVIGRASQFFLIAGLLAVLGPKFESTIRRSVEWLGWLTCIVAVLLYWFLK